MNCETPRRQDPKVEREAQSEVAMPNELEDPPYLEADAELDDLAKRVIGAAIEAHRGHETRHMRLTPPIYDLLLPWRLGALAFIPSFL
jgi:hypothetical protein